MMASGMSGDMKIDDAATEPHVTDLANFLVKWERKLTESDPMFCLSPAQN